MLVTVLGSGGSEGVPVPYCTCRVCKSGDRRYRTSYLIRVRDKFLLAEIGPDFRRQQLRYRFPIDYLFISHEHKDHIGGLTELKQIMLIAKIRIKPIQLLISKRFHKELLWHVSTDKEGVIHAYRKLLRDRKLIPNLLDYGKGFKLDGFEIELFKNKHGNLACGGFLLKSGGRSIVYLADAGMLYQKVEGLINETNPDLLIANTPFFYSSSKFKREDRNHTRRMRMTHHIGIDSIHHLQAGRILLSHSSHKSGFTHREIEKELLGYKNIMAARDGLRIRV